MARLILVVLFIGALFCSFERIYFVNSGLQQCEVKGRVLWQKECLVSPYRKALKEV